jgi:hypothetical protein
MKRYCKDCGKEIQEDYVFISSAVWGGKTMCDPNDPASIGVC